MKLRPEEITAILKDRIKEFDVETDLSEVGTVLQVGDGIARIHGLENCVALERLELEHGVVGIAFNLEEDNVGAALFGEWQLVGEGEPVRRTGEVMSVPVGEGMLGRVVDPLGNPLDGLGPIEAAERRPLEFKAPGVISRQPVKEPLQTGLKAIDSMIPIGRGQRELIIGDRSTGKTAIAIDTILNQRGGDVICVYVAIGQKGSTVAQVVERLRDEGAMEYTIVVSAPAQEAAPIKWMAPFAGCAMGEYFLYQGKHALLIYDDLSKHADSYRQLSLLLRRPPGREAFPGDVFYLHSRLLERACKLSDDLGGGSLTALPIIETQAGDVAAYIPTNVISITDGQIYLESEPLLLRRPPGDQRRRLGLARGRQRPAQGDAPGRGPAPARPLAVPRARGVRAVRLRARPGDAADRSARGERMVATLNQPQYQPWPLEEQVVAIYAGVNGYLDTIPVPQVPRFHDELREHLRTEGSVLAAIRDEGAISRGGRGEAEGGARPLPRRLQRRGGEGRSPASRLDGHRPGAQAADPVRQEHAQDHARDGARRGGEAAARRAADQGAAPVRGDDERAHRGRGAGLDLGAASAARAAGERRDRRDRAADRRPRARGRLQRADPPPRVRARALAPGGGKERPLGRGRQERALDAPLPPARARGRVPRLHRPARVRGRAGDRAPRRPSSSPRARSTASRSSTTPTSPR